MVSMQTETIIKALADPTRLRIMRLLAAMELAVGELAQVLQQSQPRVSRQSLICIPIAMAVGEATALHHQSERDRLFRGR